MKWYIFEHFKRRECLLSWYKLCKSGGAITFAGSKFRLSNMNYEEFIDSSNMHKLPNRSLMEYDATTLDFCAYHHASWKIFTEKKMILLFIIMI